MHEITVQRVVETGIEPKVQPADPDGNTFNNDSGNRVVLYVRNGDSIAHTVTVKTLQRSRRVPGLGYMEKPDAVAEVPAYSHRLIGPFPRAAFGNNPNIEYDAATLVEIAAFKV